jgi:hypothetical protein
MEIFGLVVEARMPGHPVRQNWHPFIFTYMKGLVYQEKSQNELL